MIIARAIAIIRDFLRKTGLQLRMTDSDILSLIAKGKRLIEKGKSEDVKAEGAPAFSKTTHVSRSDAREISKSRLQSAPDLSRKKQTPDGTASDRGHDSEIEPPEHDDLFTSSDVVPEKDQKSIADLYRERIGEPAYNKLSKAVVSVLSKVKLADTAPVEFRRLMRQFRADNLKSADLTKNILDKAEGLPKDERNLISDYIEGEMKAGVAPPDRIVKIATDMQAAIELQTEELIRLKMLSRDTAARWRGRYIARFYMKHAGENRFDRIMRRKFQKIDGSHLKGRGLFELVPKQDIQQWEKLGWELRAPVQEDINIEGLRGSDKVVMWRDFTPKERAKMGEIRDGVYRYARGFMETSKDIATGRLFNAIAMDENIARKYNPGDWQQIPDASITGTGVKRYGSLAGMYVPQEVYDHLAYMNEPKGVVNSAYLHLLSLWKEGKTALNPVVHSNNIVSSYIMADFAGINPLNVKAYRFAYREYRTKGKMYQEAIDHGLFGTEFYGNEIKEMLPVLSEFGSVEDASAGWLRMVGRYLSRYSGASAYRKHVGMLYQAEDQYFKMLIYIHNRNKGKSIDDSIAEAERYIFNYMDIPKGVRAIKNSPIGLPFFSYTYKAAPALVHTALTQPWKLAKWITLFGGVNWASYQYLFGSNASQQEDDERKVLPAYMRGRTALGVQKNIRLWYNGANVEAMFLDLSRRMPLGDIFDASNQMGGLPIPQPLVPNNPVFTTLLSMLANIDSFTGRKVVRVSDDAWDAARKRAGWLVRQVLPNSPVVPMSYSWDKVMNGISNAIGEPIKIFPGSQEYTGKDYYGRQQSLPRALSDTLLGIKIRQVDVPLQRRKRINELTRKLRDLKLEFGSIQRNKGMSEDDKDAQKSDLREKARRIAALRSKLQ